MITEDKFTELFCIADDFCKFFDAMMEKYTIKETKKRNCHRDSTLSKSEVIIETVNDELMRVLTRIIDRKLAPFSIPYLKMTR